MKHPQRLQRAARWLYHGGRLVPRVWRLWQDRHTKKTAPPPPPAEPQRVYRRFFTRDRSFEELVRPHKR